MNTPIVGYDFARLLALFGLLIAAFIPVPNVFPDFEAGDFELHHIILGTTTLFYPWRGLSKPSYCWVVWGISLRTQQSRTTGRCTQNHR